MENERLKELEEHIDSCGSCNYCGRPNTGRSWCNKCSPDQRESSGKNEIDKFILEVQHKTKNYDDNLEWIPYNKFKNIKKIGEGGFAKIYSAIWSDEPGSRGHVKVALKKLKSPTEAFINEMKIHNECSYANSYITQFYGITKDPETEEFFMVLEYATNGNLRKYLEINFPTLEWYKRLEILHNVIDNLDYIHNKKYIHKDLHSGNILHFDYYAKITDLGLAQSSKHDLNSNVSGVLPYIAPEVLDEKPYTFASDIYSFGIIMVEMSTGKPPYGNVPHDEKLALAICNGLRPRVSRGTPKCYIDLVNQCLDASPGKRPSSKEILKVIRNWRFHDDHEKLSSNKEFINTDNSDADKIISRGFPSDTLHPGAIYTSRLMSFSNLPKPRNSRGIQIEDPEVSDSQLIKLHVSEDLI
ncbi:uncharacterized protein OCT59_003460 [Rhizophagus irregularis]|uniref:Kinase-like domain-containing protein n=3 Tax=Rhizophagus irregularis TaxID=588596 RepID=U9U101_RHIID|nr:kinase-like domain-containing protein [Rhizophagus irregularis DAOM 181602=DAOM 197198]EXX51248.1 Ste20p [Rhizophagus irregularis DAOM 197198w]POG72694.1 kinase-like domain-containing protein [Rhizophagus irregularis DAOM 181602=DAOM 197198]UZO11907.1 hypothetical protein OCT59_003460 [Rhizophagus irregularis]GBC37412.1 kinase-like domain-containing protein [Rhizophagus irregularis DAOM 181602=DAOM 197198]|eukprot:XP_025179560.1 kinase-like domain-containing protein [Rhizophagus irregularis DAOM 181602=DAOM 197198]